MLCGMVIYLVAPGWYCLINNYMREEMMLRWMDPIIPSFPRVIDDLAPVSRSRIQKLVVLGPIRFGLPCTSSFTSSIPN